jgi:MFS family permease
MTILITTVVVSKVPIVSAHGPAETGILSQGVGIAIVTIGIATIVGAVLAKRRGWMTPTNALYAILGALFVVIIGTIIFEGTSPDPTYSAESMPFHRSWYAPMALGLGMVVAIASFLLVVWRWPGRPRYAFFGLLMASWISYPYLVPRMGRDTHPLGYLIVLATPLVVGYVVWKDVGDVLGDVLEDHVARRFGSGVTLLLTLFFLAMTGYLSFFPKTEVPNETAIVVLPVLYQLVVWPTLELAFPSVPFFLALSLGQIVIIGTLSALVGINSAVIARYWRLNDSAGGTQGTVGAATLIGTCTCGCCGPLVAKITVLAAGPTIAAPLYWIFVDSASPLSAVFIVATLTIFTTSLIYSVRRGSTAENGSTSTASLGIA